MNPLVFQESISETINPFVSLIIRGIFFKENYQGFECKQTWKNRRKALWKWHIKKKPAV